jgi:hypothetical protein
MIQLAPIRLSQGEEIELRQTYRENNVGKDWTGYTATWAVVQGGDTIASGTTTLETDGDMITTPTVAQVDRLSVPDQYRGRTLPDTYFQITVTGPATFLFRAAVTVFRGLNYTTSTSVSSGLTDNDGNTLLAE